MAAVDIGTNTLLCLVAEVKPDGRLERVVDHCRFGRLGRGVAERGELDPHAIERSLAHVREYAEIIAGEGAARVAAVGTQTLREAKNARAFTEPAEAILGAPVDVIAGEREAELVFRAVSASLPPPSDERLVVVDVGGGSTEIIEGGATGAVRSFSSVPIGAVRLTERHLRADPPREDEVAAMLRDIDAALAPHASPGSARVIGTSGTATTIASVSKALAAYDPDAIHGSAISAGEVERQLSRYLALSIDERRAVPGMQPERADVIAAGAAVYDRLLRRLGAGEIVVSDRGVRWGRAHELAEGAAAESS